MCKFGGGGPGPPTGVGCREKEVRLHPLASIVTPATHLPAITRSNVIVTRFPRPCTLALFTDGPVTWLCRHPQDPAWGAATPKIRLGVPHPQDSAWGARKQMRVHAKGEFIRDVGRGVKKDGESNRYLQGAIDAHRADAR